MIEHDLTHVADFGLRDINVQVARGSLTAVVGRVGSGKSTLLAAILYVSVFLCTHTPKHTLAAVRFVVSAAT